ncbi:transposase [uncultured Oceanisphaera sp.]|uniref:transposase n=1 Tax=uncultured Oceanisphaera sp. TaxID=353858 RepID=UPI0026159A99|nr:transposase [uncultured Oceanisphaera sp.]
MYSHIGIDVSKDKLDIGWLRDVANNKVKTKVFKHQKQSLEKLAAWLLKNTQTEPQNILITLEATGVYHENLVYFLHEQGFKVFIANPGKAKKYADAIGLVHKTDKSDAIMLAHYGMAQTYSGSLTLWQPESPEARQLKGLLRRLDALEKDHQRELNRLEACEQVDTSPRVLRSIHDMLATLQQEIAALEQEIDDHIDRHPPLRKNRKLLNSIKGVGPVVSREMTCLFAAKVFRNAKQVAAYLGLIPKQVESGNFRGHTKLSKTGPARIRAKLYMATVAAGTHNPDIKNQKRRLLGNGKNKMQALGAAMRKLVQVCYGVIKHQQEYQPQVAI